MSRARNIKPGFFKNDLLVELPFEVRLLFIGLWTLADREGRLEDRPKRIKMEIFPADSVDVDAGLNSLAASGFINRYTEAGKTCIQVLAWAKHQNPHMKEAASVLPPMSGSANRYSGDPANAEVRERIFERDGHACVKCGNSEDLQLDHIVPRSSGGAEDDANLQTLCKPCNLKKGARHEQGNGKHLPRQVRAPEIPVQAHPSPDLARLIPDSLIPDSGLSDSGLPIADPPKEEKPPARLPAVRAEKTPEAREANCATWEAYAAAYRQRYSTDPVRNASVNSQIASFVKRIGADEAPSVAAHYLSNSSQWYVTKGHAVGQMLADAEKLRTEWATGRRTTNGQARQLDSTQTNFNVFSKIIEEQKATQ